METKKQFFFMRAAMSLLVMLCSLGAWADDSGSCGTNVTYSYVESTHTLTISGTGDMEDYDDSDAPWDSYANAITTVVIEDGVTSIGIYAFFCCSGLTSVTIPASVTSIGNYAFSRCSGLTTVTIPASVTSIGKGVFEYCENLATITVEDGNMVYNSRNGCNAIIETSSNKLIAGCKNTTIPASVTSIGDDAFYGCTSLTSVEIPTNVTSIGDNAFFECTGLISVTIPASVTSIGNYAFQWCI